MWDIVWVLPHRHRSVSVSRHFLLQAPLTVLTYCLLMPTQPPTLSGTGNEQQLRLWGEGLVWLIGAMVCLLAAPWVQLSISAGNGWPHNAMRHHWLMPISCHFRDCKALLVTCLTDVSGAIASVQTFTFTFTIASQTNLQPCHRNGRQHSAKTICVK